MCEISLIGGKIPAPFIVFTILAIRSLMAQSARTLTASDLAQNYAGNKKNLRIASQTNIVQNQENGQTGNTYAHS